MIRWNEREVQAIGEVDLIENYEVLREYLFMVGESTPFPSLLDHKAWFILNMGPFTCLNHFSLGSPTISVFFAHRRPLFS